MKTIRHPCEKKIVSQPVLKNQHQTDLNTKGKMATLLEQNTENIFQASVRKRVTNKDYKVNYKGKIDRLEYFKSKTSVLQKTSF